MVVKHSSRQSALPSKYISPKVGDELYLKPHASRFEADAVRKCKVVYVNEANSFYMVEFETGIKECYKFVE